MATFKFKKENFPKDKKDFIKFIQRIIKRDVEEINSVSDRDLISIYDFFKALCDTTTEETIFATNKDSIVWKNKKELEKNTKVKIKTMEQLMAG